MGLFSSSSDESGPYHGTGWDPPSGPTMAQTEADEAEFFSAWTRDYQYAPVRHRKSGRTGRVKSISMLARTITVVMDDGEVFKNVRRPQYVFEVISN